MDANWRRAFEADLAMILGDEFSVAMGFDVGAIEVGQVGRPQARIGDDGFGSEWPGGTQILKWEFGG